MRENHTNDGHIRGIAWSYVMSPHSNRFHIPHKRIFVYRPYMPAFTAQLLSAHFLL